MEREIALSTYYYKYLKYKKKYLEIGYLENSNIFAKKEGIDYDKLIITDEGKYSITKQKDGERLLEIIKKEIKTTTLKSVCKKSSLSCYSPSCFFNRCFDAKFRR